jgi:pimeloyl-ACP methyl ester carboxylesterase
MSEARTFSRRTFCGAAAGAAIAAASNPLRGLAQQTIGNTAAIRPYRVQFAEPELVELRRRVFATRWPDKETVADDSQGVPLAMMQGLAAYWAGGYDWRRCEVKLNALPQYLTEIDGLDIHFIHVKAKHANALPVLITHGWPGSIIEQLKLIEPLTNPTAYGASASDAFDVVIPSIPGFGFSGRPTAPGWDPEHIARAWVVLMQRLGYTKFVAQGGDWGGHISNVMGEQAPPELLGIHTNFPETIPPKIGKALACGEPAPATLSADEKAAYLQLVSLRAKNLAYAIIMAQRPQTLYGLADSPVALAAFMLDHSDTYSQPASSFVSALAGETVDGHSAGDLTRDDLLDNITLFWLTNTGVSSARLYWENRFRLLSAVDVSVPAAVTVFPGEIYSAPRSWTERAYHKLVYYNRAGDGGHFAAWSFPQLFSEELRSGFRPMRAASYERISR